MNITVLGCGGPYPAEHSPCSGYLLESNGRYLLLDCGSGVAGSLLSEISLNQLDGVVLSHLHWDHCSDALALTYAIQFAINAGTLKSPVLMLMPSEPEATARLFIDTPYYKTAVFDPHYERFIGGWKIMCAPARHPVQAYALRVTHESEPGVSVVYTGDTNTHRPLLPFVQGADLLIADAALTESEWSEDAPHMSAGHAAGLAMFADVRRLMITHFRPGTNISALENEALTVFHRTVRAYPGLRVSVNPPS